MASASRCFLAAAFLLGLADDMKVFGDEEVDLFL